MYLEIRPQNILFFLLKELHKTISLENISFSNKISPKGLFPIFPKSLKPFWIVEVGIIVRAKTKGS